MTNEELAKFKRETEKTILNLKGLIDAQQQQINLLKQSGAELASKLQAKNNLGTFEDIKLFDALKILQLYAGFPIFSTTTGLAGFSGQLFLVNASGNATPRKLVGFQINNTVSTVALT